MRKPKQYDELDTKAAGTMPPEIPKQSVRTAEKDVSGRTESIGIVRDSKDDAEKRNNQVQQDVSSQFHVTEEYVSLF